jgi:hypothetical protein
VKTIIGVALSLNSGDKDGFYSMNGGHNWSYQQYGGSRHPDRVGECPLSGVKRTSKFKSVTSAFDAVDGSSTGT